MGETLRAFVAVALPSPVREALAAEQERHRPHLQVGWVRPETLHLTLHFLGDVGHAQAARIAAAVTDVCARHAPFEVRARDLGVFPNTGRPRVLWVGVQDADPLVALQGALAGPLGRCGVRLDRRRYHPHLTLARVRKPLRRQGLSHLRTMLQEVARDHGAIPVEELLLFRSELSPQGPRHTILERAALQG